MTKSKKLEFRPNDYVVYPAHGVGQIISIEHYGESADDKTLFREFGFTPEAVAAAAERAIDN